MADPRITDDGFCEAYCPDGTVRLAMQDPYAYDRCTGGAGGRALCCTPYFMGPATSDAERAAAFASALDDVITSTCTWPTTASDLNAKRTPGPEATGAARQTKRQSPGSHDYNCALAYVGTYNMMGTLDADLRAALDGAWNQAVVQDHGYQNLPASRMHMEPSGVAFSLMESPVATMFAENILNVIPDLAEHALSDETVLLCPILWDADQTVLEDEDDGGTDEGYPYVRRSLEEDDGSYANVKAQLKALAKRLEERAANTTASSHTDVQSVEELLAGLQLTEDEAWLLNTTLAQLRTRAHPQDDREASDVVRQLLEERQALAVGAVRYFRIRSTTNPSWTIQTIKSSQYPNGNDGADLQNLNADYSRYKVVARGCGPQDYTLNTAAAPSDSLMWVCK